MTKECTSETLYVSKDIYDQKQSEWFFHPRIKMCQKSWVQSSIDTIMYRIFENIIDLNHSNDQLSLRTVANILI